MGVSGTHVRRVDGVRSVLSPIQYCCGMMSRELMSVGWMGCDLDGDNLSGVLECILWGRIGRVHVWRSRWGVPQIAM